MTDEQARADAQYAGPATAELGDPANDPPLTIRVHPDDDPQDPRARRAIKTDRAYSSWRGMTGETDSWYPGHEIANWPVQDWVVATWRLTVAHKRARGELKPGRTVSAPAPLDGADAEGSAPFKDAR